MNKKDKLSKENQDFINENKDDSISISDENIKKIDEFNEFNDISKENIKRKRSLRKSSTWKLLKKQFSDEELDVFEEKYTDLMQQFKEDVLKTEEVQLFHSIKLEISLKN